MLQTLIDIDQQWLLAINHWNALWADELMWIISAKWTWIPLYALLVGLIVWRYRKPSSHAKGFLSRVPACVWILIGFAIAVGLADYISSGIIKHAVCRWRPTHEPTLEGLIHIVHGYTGGRYGFVSSHAANTMSCALLFCLIWQHPKKNISPCWWLMLWVVLNCYSRMYLGVHYPGDILGGLIVGSLVAVGVYVLLRNLKVVEEASNQNAKKNDDHA